MEATKPLYKWEKEAIRLRYHEGLCRLQIAERLNLRPSQIKYIFSKPNVKHYIRMQIQPYFWKLEIAEIEAKLADPVGAYAEDLRNRSADTTYIWLGPGQKCYYSNNKTRFQAAKQFGRILGVTGDQKTLERDLGKAICKHTEKLAERLRLLKSANPYHALLFKW